MRTRLLVLTLGLVLALGGGGVALASSAARDDGAVVVCAKKSTGALRLVAKASKCRASERVVRLGTTGPAGAPGAAGAAGAAGAPGAPGAPGAAAPEPVDPYGTVVGTLTITDGGTPLASPVRAATAEVLADPTGQGRVATSTLRVTRVVDADSARLLDWLARNRRLPEVRLDLGSVRFEGEDATVTALETSSDGDLETLSITVQDPTVEIVDAAPLPPRGPVIGTLTATGAADSELTSYAWDAAVPAGGGRVAYAPLHAEVVPGASAAVLFGWTLTNRRIAEVALTGPTGWTLDDAVVTSWILSADALGSGLAVELTYGEVCRTTGGAEFCYDRGAA